MELEPKSAEPTQFERLVCELVRTQDLVNIDGDEQNVSIWLGDWQLTLSKNGKWRID